MREDRNFKASDASGPSIWIFILWFKDTLSHSGAGRGKEPKKFQIMVMLHAHLLVLKFQKLQALMDSVSYFGRPLVIGGGGGNCSAFRHIFFWPSPCAECFSWNVKGIFLCFPSLHEFFPFVFLCPSPPPPTSIF
jgi:hypothetical protein